MWSFGFLNWSTLIPLKWSVFLQKAWTSTELSPQEVKLPNPINEMLWLFGFYLLSVEANYEAIFWDLYCSTINGTWVSLNLWNKDVSLIWKHGLLWQVTRLPPRSTTPISIWHKQYAPIQFGILSTLNFFTYISLPHNGIRDPGTPTPKLITWTRKLYW